MEDEEQRVLNELNLGISELDDQHQAFFLHMVGLRRALIDGMGGRDKLMKTLRFLQGWVQDHFQAEERLMRTHNYPGILVHRLEHEKFAKVVAEFSAKARDLDERGEVTSFLAVEVEHKLENWLTGHIKKMDLKMAEFVKGSS
ncbi:MAG: bacteriohemerythrin [Nitrospirota bacterium]|nr:bacteriohemerythrin [Nitrospirota bacterium]